MKPRFFLPRFLLLSVPLIAVELVIVWLILFVKPSIIPCASLLTASTVFFVLCKELFCWIMVFVPRWEQEIDRVILAYGQ